MVVENPNTSLDYDPNLEEYPLHVDQDSCTSKTHLVLTLHPLPSCVRPPRVGALAQ